MQLNSREKLVKMGTLILDICQKEDCKFSEFMNLLAQLWYHEVRAQNLPERGFNEVLQHLDQIKTDLIEMRTAANLKNETNRL